MALTDWWQQGIGQIGSSMALDRLVAAWHWTDWWQHGIGQIGGSMALDRLVAAWH